MPAPRPSRPQPASAKPTQATAPRQAKTPIPVRPRPDSSPADAPRPPARAGRRGTEAGEGARPPSSRISAPKRFPWPLVVIGSLVVVALIVVLSWKSVAISMKLSALDGCKGAIAEGQETAAAPNAQQLMDADRLAAEFVTLVQADRGEVLTAITNDRGPWQAQVKIGELALSVDALSAVCARQKDPVAQAAALAAIARIYKPERDLKAQLPRELPDWALNQTAPRPLRLNAIAVLAARGDDDAAGTLSGIARKQGEDSELVQTVLTALATVLERGEGQAGYVIGLLGSPIAEAATANPSLRKVLIDRSTIGLMPKLLPLLSHPLESVRSLTLEAMGGPMVSITDGPNAAKDREKYGKEIAPKLTDTTPEAEQIGALKAVHRLRLTGARTACIALLPRLCVQPLAGIDSEFLGQLHGDSLIDLKSPEGRTQAELQVKDLTAALATATTRTAAAKALGRITGNGAKDLAAIQPAIVTLAGYADQQDTRTALHAIVGTGFNRKEVVQQLGSDSGKWQSWLTQQDKTRVRLGEVETWFDQQDMTVLQVKAGPAKLKEAAAYLTQARTDLDAMVEDSSFIAPLGWSKGSVTDLQMRVRATWQGVHKAMTSVSH